MVQLRLDFCGSLRGLIATQRVPVFVALIEAELRRRGGGSGLRCVLDPSHGRVCLVGHGFDTLHEAERLQAAVRERPIAVGHKGGSARYQTVATTVAADEQEEDSDSDAELVMFD